MTNVFSSTPFLESLAAAHFPGERCTIETFRLEGQRFRLLVAGGRPVVEVPWMDFVEPLDEPASPGAAADRRLAWLPNCALATLTVPEWKAGPGTQPERMPSPFIDWRQFPTFAAFDERPDNGGRTGGERRRRFRRIEKAYGDARYTFHDTDPVAFEQCIAWKRAQYKATGIGGDALADPRAVRLFREMLDRGLIAVSTLRGGDTLLAVHIGAIWDGRLYWWVPSYDAEHGRLGPGRVLLETMLEDSYARGHREFDFLLGDEEYKWWYSTHTRVVGPRGTPPLSLRVRRLAKGGIKRALQLSPRLWDAAQRMRKRLRSS